MPSRRIAAILLPLALAAQAPAQPPAPSAAGTFFVEPVTERSIDQLPPGPLFWRIERFASLAEAESGRAPTALAANVAGRAWRFTLGPAGGASPGGERVAEIGPVPRFAAPRYLLRLNRAGGPPGARTPVHSHPGSEAFFVLGGELSQRTPHGTLRVAAGQAMNGHAPGMAMQLTSSGTSDLEQLVLFVVDATRPFSEPARLD